MIVSLALPHVVRSVSDKHCREKQNNTFLFSVTFFFRKSCVCEIMWKNIVELDRPQIIIWRIHIACWIHKATNTHSQYVILIACFRFLWPCIMNVGWRERNQQMQLIRCLLSSPYLHPTYCFSTAGVSARTLLYVMLYIHCLSCFTVQL